MSLELLLKIEPFIEESDLNVLALAKFHQANVNDCVLIFGTENFIEYQDRYYFVIKESLIDNNEDLLETAINDLITNETEVQRIMNEVLDYSYEVDFLCERYTIANLKDYKQLIDQATEL